MQHRAPTALEDRVIDKSKNNLSLFFDLLPEYVPGMYYMFELEDSEDESDYLDIGFQPGMFSHIVTLTLARKLVQQFDTDITLNFFVGYSGKRKYFRRSTRVLTRAFTRLTKQLHDKSQVQTSTAWSVREYDEKFFELLEARKEALLHEELV